jgi:hypothetical protein
MQDAAAHSDATCKDMQRVLLHVARTMLPLPRRPARGNDALPLW